MADERFFQILFILETQLQYLGGKTGELKRERVDHSCAVNKPRPDSSLSLPGCVDGLVLQSGNKSLAKNQTTINAIVVFSL